MNHTHNYQTYKSDFKKDTGFDADKDTALYIQYYSARMNDLSMQYLFKIQQILVMETREGIPSTVKNQIQQIIDLKRS